MLEVKLALINKALGTPAEPYRKENGTVVVNEGCIFLDNAYGGFSICKMCNGGGQDTIITSGYFSKPIILHQLTALYKGILAGREYQPTQIS